MRDLDQLDAMTWSIMKPGAICIDASKDYTFDISSLVSTSIVHSFALNVKNNIKDVIFDEINKSTIVKWKDGNQTVVVCQEEDEYNPYVGFYAAICKYAFGNKGDFNNTVEYWVGKKDRENAAKKKEEERRKQIRKEQEEATKKQKERQRKKEERERERRIEEKKEAYKRALQELKGWDSV